MVGHAQRIDKRVCGSKQRWHLPRNAMAVSSVGREVGWRGVSEAGKWAAGGIDGD